MRDDNAYLQHILEAISKIERYLKDVAYAEFSNDSKTVDAVVRELEIIGEASHNLSEDFKKLYPILPWREMHDMRNMLTHEYFGVNLNIVWDTCHGDIPPLKKSIEGIIPQ